MGSKRREFWNLLRLVLLGLFVTGGFGHPAAGADASDEYLIKNWTTTDGVPHNTVRAIIGSREGYLWLGTANGLARFDGLRFVTFDRANSPAMVDDDIFSLHEDQTGTLWYRTRKGVGSRRSGQFEFQDFTGRNPYALDEAFIEDTSGQLWLRGRHTLARLQEGKWEDVTPAIPGGIRIEAVAATVDGGLWLAGDRGLWRYRDGAMVLVQPVEGINRIAMAPDGQIWALVDHGRLFTLDQRRWSHVRDLPSDNFHRLFASPNGDVWLAERERISISRLRDGHLIELTSQHPFQGNRILAHHRDRDGNIWLGGNAAGLYRLRERQVRVYGLNEGLLGANVTSIGQTSDGTILANVMASTMHRFNGDRFEPIEVGLDDRPFVNPTALMPAAKGGVWSGTFGGSLPRIQDGKVRERIGASGGTRSLFTDREGNLWRGTRTAGVEVFSGAGLIRLSSEEGLSSDNVYCFAQDGSGAVWVGTEDGLNRIQGGQITQFGLSNGLRHTFISALCVDSRGTLWAGTLGGGLSGWNGTRFVTLTTQEGLAHNSIEQIVEDELGMIWLGTRVGLLRLSVAKLHEFLEGTRAVVAGELIDEEDGIERSGFWTQYQPATLKATDGVLWFCTGNGVLAIDPKDFLTEPQPPLTQIEELIVDGTPQTLFPDVGRMPEIGPDCDRLEIRYTGIGLSKAEQIRFRYRLAGYDRKWVDAGTHRLATYSRLPPGPYRFEIMARNAGSGWNEQPAAISFHVRPAFDQTWWFRGMLMVMFVGLMVLVHRWRVRGLERKRLVQEAFSRRLIESQEVERKRIAAELHDSLGQNLLVVRNLALMAAGKHRMDPPTAVEFQEISDTAGQALDEVRSISHALRPVELDRLGLTRSIQESVRRVGDSAGIRIDLELDNLDEALPADQQINFYRIVQECLSNIVKHSKARTASVEVQVVSREIRLVVADDGRGFDPAAPAGQTEVSSGLGLVGVVERARALGGVAEVHSRPGDGTRIEVRVPLA